MVRRVVVVGAGPAGIAAAERLVGAREIEVTLIDEGQRMGGQIYRRPPDDLTLDMAGLLGRDYDAYRRFHETASGLAARLDYRPETLAWNVFGSTVHTLRRGKLEALPFDALVLATGATDRILPVRGWTLPGVFTLGGAQVLLKDQGCLIGRRVVFCGSSPLLYLAALQYARAGGAVVAVLDTTPLTSKLRAVPDLAGEMRIFAKGLSYIWALRRRGIPIHVGVQLESFLGDTRVDGVAFRASGAARRLACDAVAFGFGLRSEIQLAELAGCELRYDPVLRQWFPAQDTEGRCGNGIYVAGDGSRIGGAEAARLSGELAGGAILADLGLARRPPDRAAARLHQLLRFQRGLAKAFDWPHERIADLADDVVLCRCENILVGEVRRALHAELGATEANRVKATTRCGMGRCQGRFCGPAAAELVAAELGRGDGALDRLRAQPPVKPLPLAAALGGAG
jgi:NADPH-dependent 2,4-dienoyl-CoA reductase/sulfur reductase-like enzyme